jgi:uncharacterized repeat protein (TIGR01451 family)
MRIGIKLLALCGLCGFVLSCLMGLAEDGPAPERSAIDFLALPPGQLEPAAQEPPKKYSRTRTAPEPKADGFPNNPVRQSAPQSANPSFDPLGAELPPATEAASADALIHAQYQDAGFAPDLPMASEEQNAAPEPAAVPLSEATTLFPASPLPVPAENVPVLPEGEHPTPAVDELVIEPAAPVTPLSPSLPVASLAADPQLATAVTVEPTTGPQTAMVSLEWVKRTEVNVGQECQCDLVVKNTGDTSARGALVQVSLPASARLLPQTTPAPKLEGNQLQWQLGELAPKQSRTIQIHLIPTSRGDLTTSATVHFAAAAQAAFRVQEPLLEVELQGPKEVQLGDPASQIIQVSNPGTGTARNVEIKALIPEGLEHPQGKQLTMAIGSLNPGETRMVRLALSAVGGGKHQVKVLAEARLNPKEAPYLRKLCESDISIISPSVKVVADGPGLRYKNRNATYEITVVNDGTADSNNVRVLHKIPDGFQFVSATEDGKHDALSKTVAWFVGRIAPGQSTAMSVTLEAVKLGDFEHQISAITDQGARSEDRIPTKVEGIAALTLEVNDINDPVEIGVETAYEIHVKNQGTQFAQNVAVACELPAGVELVDVKAPCAHNLQGRVVVFQNLPKLDADQTATYRIIVRGQADGYQRFRARLASDSIQEPLIVEELTKFYGE